MRDVAIAGVGQTEFGTLPKGIRELGSDAARKAIVDAELSKGDVDAAYVGNLGGPADRQRSIVGQYCLREIGLTGLSVTNLENACSSSACAFRQAYRAVAGGFEDVALVLGVEKMTGVSTEEATGGLGGAADVERENDRGFTFLGKYAMAANAYQATHDLSPDMLRETLTSISVKNHRNALANPYAHFSKEISPKDVVDSPMIASPLRLYDTCPTSDGAAAAVIAADDVLPESPDPRIVVEASVHRTGDYESTSGLADPSDEAATVDLAYERTGLSPHDVDVFEVHDAATIGELIRSEAVGLCEPGKGAEYVLEGHTEIDGKTPVNPSGGLKARGHPVGATGIAQINELVWQLSGNAEGRQVPDAETGLALNTGGALNGKTANHTVHVLRAR